MIKINAAARLIASTASTHYIRRKSNDKLVEAYEGDDGLSRAKDLVEIHNKHYPNDKWYVVSDGHK